MAFFIPVDLFGSYTDGYEIGRKSVWDDRNQAEKVTEARIKNIHDADTLEGRIADTNNKYFDNYLGYQFNERKQPGNLAQADIYNVASIDARDVAYEPGQRTLNKNTLRTGNQLAYETNRANLRQARGAYGSGGGGTYAQPSGADRQATYNFTPENGEQGQGQGQGQGALFSWGAAGAATSNAQSQTQPSSGADVASSYVDVITGNNPSDDRSILSEEEAEAQWKASDLYRQYQEVAIPENVDPLVLSNEEAEAQWKASDLYGQSQEVAIPENVEESAPPLVYPPGRKSSPYPVWDNRPSAISGALRGEPEASRSSLAEWSERRNAQIAPPRPKKEVAPRQPEQPRRSNSQMFFDSIRGTNNRAPQPEGNLSGPEPSSHPVGGSGQMKRQPAAPNYSSVGNPSPVGGSGQMKRQPAAPNYIRDGNPSPVGGSGQMKRQPAAPNYNMGGNLSGPVTIDVIGNIPKTQAEYDARAMEVQDNINSQQVAYEQSLFDSIEDEDLLLFAEQGQLPAGVYQFSYPNELGYSGIFVDENKNVQYV